MIEDRKEEIKISLRNYKNSLYKAVRNKFVRLALRRGIDSFRPNQTKAFKLYPSIKEKSKHLKEIKEYSIDHIEDLVKQTMETFEAQGGCGCWLWGGFSSNSSPVKETWL